MQISVQQKLEKIFRERAMSPRVRRYRELERASREEENSGEHGEKSRAACEAWVGLTDDEKQQALALMGKDDDQVQESGAWDAVLERVEWWGLRVAAYGVAPVCAGMMTTAMAELTGSEVGWILGGATMAVYGLGVVLGRLPTHSGKG